jgi:hypothetical protein
VSLFSQLLVSRVFEALRWLVGCVTFVGSSGGMTPRAAAAAAAAAAAHRSLGGGSSSSGGDGNSGGFLGAACSWLAWPWGGTKPERVVGFASHGAQGSSGQRWSYVGSGEEYGGSRRLQRRSTTSLDLPVSWQRSLRRGS